MIRKFVSLFSIVLFFLASMADAVSMIPVMISEDTPTRIGVSVVESTSFSPLAINNLYGVLGLAYGFGGGFEGGFQFRGGVKSDKLFDPNATTNWLLGGEAQIRYLGNITDFLYIGLQGGFGYTYTFGLANITQGSGLSATVGVPLGLSFSDNKYVVYAMAEFRFGGKTAALPEEVFGSLVGLGGAFGTYIYVGGPSIYAEIRPGTTDISQNQNNTFVLDATVGIAFDL